MKEYVVEIKLRNTINKSVQDLVVEVTVPTLKEAKALCIVMENVFDLPKDVREALRILFGINHEEFCSMYQEIDVVLHELETTRKEINYK